MIKKLTNKVNVKFIKNQLASWYLFDYIFFFYVPIKLEEFGYKVK